MTEISQYDYELPRHLIAQAPLANRADSRLMVVDRKTGGLDHRHVRDLPEVLRPIDCLVLNDTRVIPARLVGYRAATRGHWEGLFLEADQQGFWRVMCKTRGKMVTDEAIVLINCRGEDDITLRIGTRLDEGTWIVRPETSEPLLPLLERVGRVPLPPYIRHGEMVESDRRHYQTVYARVPGAVAAPTAGLHFTEALLDRIAERGITVCYLTLHVGPGTFRPITDSSLAEHRLESEWGQLNAETVERITACRARGGRCVAVGTTTARLLETAAADGQLKPFQGRCDLFIRPPYRFQVVDALMTNFHLPRTTLLVLVYTFGGETLMRRAYQEAIREEYRFYSYGDAMLIL